MNFGNGEIRPVEIPDGAIVTLDMIYSCGQNNSFNRHLNMPSVSKGDIIHFEGKKFIVKSIGFEELDELKYLTFHWLLRKSLDGRRKYTDLMWEIFREEAFEYC